MIAALLILATLGLGYTMPIPSGTYIQTGECQVSVNLSRTMLIMNTANYKCYHVAVMRRFCRLMKCVFTLTMSTNNSAEMNHKTLPFLQLWKLRVIQVTNSFVC